MLLAGRPLWIKRVMSEYEICESETDRIDEYYQLMEEFNKEANLQVYDSKTVYEFISTMHNSNDTVTLDLRKNGKVIGLIGGIIMEHPFERGRFGLVELVWYVTKECRKSLWSIRLFKAFEKVGIERGIKYIVTGLMKERTNFESLQKFYTKVGYNPLEINYIKVL
jgi:helix-turn-helix protein